jgi:predicted nucleic acid-binding protein
MKITCPGCKRRIRLKKSRNIKCKCGHEFSYSTYFGKDRVFLIDANIIIYSLNNDPQRGKSCKKVLSLSNIATTERVLNEVQNYKNKKLKIYNVKEISEELKELKTNKLKQPSQKDLSLIQAAIDHPEIGGIITYDRDFKAIATSGLIKSKSSKYAAKFFVGNAKDFLKKYGRKNDL